MMAWVDADSLKLAGGRPMSLGGRSRGKTNHVEGEPVQHQFRGSIRRVLSDHGNPRLA
jgi:hypothetical protein